MSENTIEKNKQIILEKNKKYEFYSEGLLNYLGENLFTAPASTMLSLHNAFEGGLADHILRTAKHCALIRNNLPEELRPSIESTMKVAFLAEIGKVNLYKPQESEWHRNKLGKMYEFDESIVSLRVGERSAFYALKYNTELNTDEYQAILNYDKEGDDKQAKWHTEPLGEILKMGTKLAIMEEKLNNSK